MRRLDVTQGRSPWGPKHYRPREYVLIKVGRIQWWWYRLRHPAETPETQLINWIFNGDTP